MKEIRELVQGRPVLTVKKTDTVQQAAEIMQRHNVGALAVMDGPHLAGVFSERDVINRVVAKQYDPAKTSVGSVMTRSIVVAQAEESLASCLRKMKLANCRHLPVVEGDVLIGMLSLRDLLQVEMSEQTERIEFLQHYLFHLPPESGGE